VDVNDRVVLMEDVARLIDYDNIPMGAAIGAPTRGQDAKTSRLRTAIADQLVSVGWYETKNDPLEAANASKWMGAVPDAITLANAATNEMSVLRRSLLTGLLASTQRNIFRGASRVRLFEIDRTFATLPGAYTLSGIAGGVARSAVWRGGEAKIDFFTLKGEIEDLFDSLGISGVTFAPAIRKPFKPGETAQIALADNVIGHAGLIDTTVVKIERQTYSLYGFEIDLTHVTEAFDAPIVYRPVNKLPPSTRDLAIVVKSSESFATLESIIRTSAGDLLESVQLVDEYRGNPVPKDHRSLAFRLTYRAADRTLTADEVQASVDRVVASLSEKTGATLRA
jgi:phenylalanyl-tRNA synthetase beta chain